MTHRLNGLFHCDVEKFTCSKGQGENDFGGEGSVPELNKALCGDKTYNTRNRYSVTPIECSRCENG